MKKLSRHIKHLAPWIVAAGIFFYLFHLYPPSKVWQSLQYVNIFTFSLFAAGYFGFIYLVDSWVMKRVLTRFFHAVSLKDMLIGRGVTYLIMVINYPASQAAFAYYLKRKYDIAIFEALATFFFIMFVDLIWLLTLAFIGSFFQTYTIGGVPLGRTVQITAAVVYGFAILWILFWRRWPDSFSIKFPFIQKIRSRRVFNIFNKASILDYLKTAVMRTPIHVTIIISTYVIMKTFNSHIPFLKILGNMPLVFFIGTLPITPGGLGTTNAATVQLLSPYLTSPVLITGLVTPEELLFTATLLWTFVNYGLKVIIGTFLLRVVSKDLFKPTPEMPEEVVEHEASPLGGNI